jgi:hypothetical protein
MGTLGGDDRMSKQEPGAPDLTALIDQIAGPDTTIDMESIRDDIVLALRILDERTRFTEEELFTERELAARRLRWNSFFN